MRGRIEALEATAQAHTGHIDELAFLRQRVYAINHWSHNLTDAFARIETAASERRRLHGEQAVQAALGAVAADRTRAERNRVWADAFAIRLPTRGRILALAGGGDWLALLAAGDFEALAAEPAAALAAALRAPGVVIESAPAPDVLRRTADASLDGLSVLAWPAVTRTMPALELLAEARRVLRADGVLLLAFAREAVTLVDALLEPTAPAAAPDALAAGAHSERIRGHRAIDAADGTPALLGAARHDRAAGRSAPRPRRTGG